MKTLTISVVLATLSAAPLRAASQGAPQAPLLGRQQAAGISQHLSSAIPVVPSTVIPINALPFAVNAPGYYQVTKNLTGVAGAHGIDVNVSYVVIDLNGFRLSGAAGSMAAVYAPSDCTVINGEIDGWAEGTSLADRGRVTNVEVSNCLDFGIGVASGLVEGCTVRNCGGNGIWANGPGTVIGCTVRNSGARGFQGFDGSLVQDSSFRQNSEGLEVGAYSQVLRCIVEGNFGNGIRTGNACVVYDSSAFDNDGLAILSGARNRILGCYAEGNREGIFTTDDSLVADCTALDNAGNGIFVLRSTVERCTVTGNPFGIVVSTPDGRVEDCAVTGSSQAAVSVAGNAWVSGNTIDENTGTGIRVASSGNRIDGNLLAQNGLGIEVTGSRNLIVRNSLDMNTVQMQIAPDNVQGPFLKTKGFVDNTNPWANFDLSFPTSFP